MRKSYSIRILTDRRKKITTGYKGLSAKGIEIPKKTNGFVFANPETGEVYFEELIEFYGNIAQRVYIMFPSNNITDFFNDDFGLWTSTNQRRRRCNGEECEHMIDEVIQGTKYEAGTESECVCKKHKLFETEDKELSKLKCGLDMYLKAYILHPETGKIISPTCYMFYSGSENTADNLRSQLDNLKKLEGIPFALSVVSHKKGDRSFTIWEMTPFIPPQKLIEIQRYAESDTEGFLEMKTGEIKQLNEHIESVNDVLPANTDDNDTTDAEINDKIASAIEKGNQETEPALQQDKIRCKINECKNVLELKKLWEGLTADEKVKYEKYKEIRKKELTKK
jgi:hypothetical protein